MALKSNAVPGPMDKGRMIIDRGRGGDQLEKAIKAGERELEAQRQADALLRGAYVSGRDRAKLKR